MMPDAGKHAMSVWSVQRRVSWSVSPEINNELHSDQVAPQHAPARLLDSSLRLRQS